jgi:primosomal protein N'
VWRRAGLDAASQALATWMEAAAWAGPKGQGGRVLVHTREPGEPAVQALVRWDPWLHHRAERRRRAEAGFPPGFPVFRVTGRQGIERALVALDPVHLLSSDLGDETVCLVTLRPGDVGTFRDRAVAWAEEGLVIRVEAEPQL